MEKRISLLKIFAVFAKIGAFTIGGGYAILPIIQDEMARRGWINEDELPDIIALAQSAPGILTANVSIFAGHKLRGTAGSIAATLGSITPSFLIILLIAMVFTDFKDNPLVASAFAAIRPVVVALIAAPAIRMAMKTCHNPWTWCIAAASLVAVAFLHISPIMLLAGIIIASYIWRS